MALSLTAAASAQPGIYTLSSGNVSLTDPTFTAMAADVSPVYVTGGNLTLSNATLTKSGDSSSTDKSSQYGLNAGVLLTAGSVTLTGGSVITAADGANGLFATGSTASVSMSNGLIYTSGDASHGVDATYGGTITLNNVTITTTATSASAALSTDFGGGTVIASNVTVTTSGAKSPAIYSTGNITVSNSTMTANGGPGGVIDGSNSITLSQCTLTAKTNGIYIHHTAAGSGTANVTITGGSLAATNDAFYATAESGSQTVVITVKANASVSAGSGYLVDALSNSTVTLTGDGVSLAGALIADATSTAAVKLQNSASLSGVAGTRTSVTTDTTSTWYATTGSTPASIDTAGTLSLSGLSTPITVSAAAKLSGTLAIALSAAPTAGTYVVLQAGSVSGTFTKLSIPALSSSQTAALSYTGTTVVVTVSGTATAVGPTITSQPSSTTVALGRTAVFGVAASGSGLTYQWSKDGAAVSGATSAQLVLSTTTASSAGSYRVIVSNGTASTTSSAATLTVVTTIDPGRLTNISSRAYVGTDTAVMIAGFNTGGAGTSGTQALLIRGIGPQLDSFHLSGVLVSPVLTLFDANGNLLDQNSSWAGSSVITRIAAAVGAFSLTITTSDDTALYESAMGKGGYTALVSGANATTGLALVEVYDATSTYSATTPRLINLSTRANVGTGSQILVGGFTISGSTNVTVLIRAAGPALGKFNLGGTLADPKLQLFNSSGTLLTSNIGWAGSAQIAASAARIGAFTWTSSSSADSALLVTLPPGGYTAQVSSASEGTGLALIEVYEVP